MKKLTTKQFIKCFYTALFLLALFCPFFIDGEWHFWVTKLFTQGIEPAGKELALRCVLVLFLLLGKLFSGTGRRWEVRRAIRGFGGIWSTLPDPYEDEPMDKDLEWNENPKKSPKAVLDGDGMVSRREVEKTLACLEARGFSYRFSKSYGEEVYTYQKKGLQVELYNSKETFYCMIKQGKQPMTEFSKCPLLPEYQKAPYREASEERKLQIIADVLSAE